MHIAFFGAAIALELLHIAFTRHRNNKQSQETIEALRKERQDERRGRTKAEKEVRELQLRFAKDADVSETSTDLVHTPFPMRPIGILWSVFTQRNGTPRQPLLVQSAISKLKLRPELSSDFFSGIENYSHCILLYVFHKNTDLQRIWQQGDAGVRGKIRVPRLDGQKLGVFATRSPHRPNPIGLSVARIVKVQGSTLILAGADVCDGTPVLDIKPYTPFDCIKDAKTPHWVTDVAEDEPLHISTVSFTVDAEQQLESTWSNSGSLYSKFIDLKSCVVEVLSRDIRSVTQRIKVPARGNEALSLSMSTTPDDGDNNNNRVTGGSKDSRNKTVNGGISGEGKWRVVLDGIDITYDIDSEKNVTVKSAARAS